MYSFFCLITFLGTRCLDCEEPNQSIELVYTQTSINQKNILNFLLHKGLNDKEIYQEMNRIYGKHVVINATCTDGSLKSNGTYLRNVLKAQGLFMIGYLGFRFLKKKF